MTLRLIDPDASQSERGEKKAQSTSLSNEIFRNIRNDIVMCRLRPGAKLQVDRLAEGFDVSLSSVREALSRLSAEGLVVARPQRGFWVASLSVEDLRDITRARVEIESICVRWSVENADEASVKALTDVYNQLQVTDPLDPDTMEVTNEWEALHNAFHEALVSTCDNETLKTLRRQLFEKAERYRRLAGRVVQRERNIGEEHRLIYGAAMKRDGVLAAALLASHIRQTAQNLMTVDSEQLAALL